MPQLNIIAIGFGLNSLVVLGGLTMGIGAIAWVFQEQIQTTLDLLVESLVTRVT